MFAYSLVCLYWKTSKKFGFRLGEELASETDGKNTEKTLESQ